jgi:hypothetical protein
LIFKGTGKPLCQSSRYKNCSRRTLNQRASSMSCSLSGIGV